MIDDFEDHCWKDIVDDEILEIYEPYRRDVKVGRNPAVLAIDLYNKAYQGGARPVREVNRLHSGSCGIHAWNALEPTRQLFDELCLVRHVSSLDRHNSALVADCHDTVGVFAPNDKPIRLCRSTFLVVLRRVDLAEVADGPA